MTKKEFTFKLTKDWEWRYDLIVENSFNREAYTDNRIYHKFEWAPRVERQMIANYNIKEDRYTTIETSIKVKKKNKKYSIKLRWDGKNYWWKQEDEADIPLEALGLIKDKIREL